MTEQPRGLEIQSGILVPEEEWAKLENIFQAIQGTGELILYSGDETFLPEMRTENFASIHLGWASHGLMIMERATSVHGGKRSQDPE